MHEHETFRWVTLIPGLEQVPNHIVMAILVAGLLIFFGTIAAMLLKSKDFTIPEARLTFRNFFDLLAEKLYALCESVMGEHEAEKFFPVIATLFIFIFFSNIFGLIPGFMPATDNLNTTLAAGLFVFLFYNFQGLREHGLKYIKHFFGPVWYLAPLMFVIELVSHMFRPISLGLRLRGNIMGDHVVIGAMSSLVPYVLPVAFLFLGLFVAVVQAFVFCLLTMVYISLSTAHDH